MSDSVLNFDDITDFRYNPFTQTYTPKTIGYGANPAERRTIPNTAPYWIKLFESPQENIPSTTRITLVVGGTELKEVSKTTTPANLQYHVNYDELAKGIVEFNSAQKGLQVDIQYYGLGTNLQKQTIATLAETITAINNNLGYKLNVINIGDWNMDTTSFVDVASGVSDYTRIRNVIVGIKRDSTSTLRHDFRNDASGTIDWDNTSNIRITRSAGGYFDNANFDETSYNRGWVFVFYEE